MEPFSMIVKELANRTYICRLKQSLFRQLNWSTYRKVQVSIELPSITDISLLHVLEEISYQRVGQPFLQGIALLRSPLTLHRCVYWTSRCPRPWYWENTQWNVVRIQTKSTGRIIIIKLSIVLRSLGHDPSSINISRSTIVESKDNQVWKFSYNKEWSTLGFKCPADCCCCWPA